ncbi:hypothetical protein C8R45DRAFT_1084580 [Mycena sanguinolenta]|nr:hypothetical protein C8R45DRAFT_1084580 [Mycena sanguinolenta]
MELRRYGLWRHLALHFEELLTRCTSCPINSRKEDSHWCKSSKVGTGRNMRKHWARPIVPFQKCYCCGSKAPFQSKKVNFFPTSRSMELFFEARVLDCWRIFFQADNIIQHFEQCGTRLPDTESLWVSARMLVRHYASQEAYTHALNQKLAECASNTMRVPRGTHWVAPANNSSSNRGDDENMDVDPEEETEGVVVDESEELRGLKEFFPSSVWLCVSVLEPRIADRYPRDAAEGKSIIINAFAALNSPHLTPPQVGAHDSPQRLRWLDFAPAASNGLGYLIFRVAFCALTRTGVASSTLYVARPARFGSAVSSSHDASDVGAGWYGARIPARSRRADTTYCDADGRTWPERARESTPLRGNASFAIHRFASANTPISSTPQPPARRGLSPPSRGILDI